MPAPIQFSLPAYAYSHTYSNYGSLGWRSVRAPFGRPEYKRKRVAVLMTPDPPEFDEMTAEMTAYD